MRLRGDHSLKDKQREHFRDQYMFTEAPFFKLNDTSPGARADKISDRVQILSLLRSNKLNFGVPGIY